MRKVIRLKGAVHVLIIEDSEVDAAFALRALRYGGFSPTHRRVQTAVELAAALEAERWDAVIADFSMPGFTGIEALAIFRSKGLDIPFIIVSGVIGEETAVDAMKAGASDYVRKGNLARLAPALERELREAAIRADHRRGQRDLVATAQRLRMIIETEPECVKVLDAKGAALEMNAAGLAMLEAASLAEVQSRPLVDFIVPGNRPAFIALHERVLKGETGILEFEIIGMHGGRRWIETRAAPLGGGGDGAILLGISRDVTERKQAEKNLQESEAKYRHLIEQAVDGIFISDAQGKFTLVNSRACELLGYTEEQLIGMSGGLICADGEGEGHFERIRPIDAGKAVRFERMIRRKDGSTFPAEISVKMLDDGTVQVIFHDITERRSQAKKISRLSRIQKVVSHINAAMVRIRERRELFQEACRIIVEHGHFILGWIAVLDDSGKLTAVAQAGIPDNDFDGYLLDGSIALVAGGTAEIALREKRAAVDNAIEDGVGAIPEVEPDTMMVRRAAIKIGARSVIVLPLVVAGKTFGVLTLYASERAFFDEEEIKLLNDLASDVSFGLEFIVNNEKGAYLAYHDALTGLANRNLFLEWISQYTRNVVGGEHKCGVLIIDIERFKNINESLGRISGDALLGQVARWLGRNLADTHLLARVGSDHFAILIPEVSEESDVARLIERTTQAFMKHPFQLDGAVYRMAIKVGVALYPADGGDAEVLFRNAEAALNKAKASGDRYLFYTQKMTATVAGKLTLENQLRHALDNDEFVLHYQPKISLVTGMVTGAEALIRWNDPLTGLVLPGHFIPILEETGLINEVGRWAVHKAIADYVRWRKAGLAAVRLGVNVSALQLRNGALFSEIKDAMGIEASAGAGLELEITESVIMEDVKRNIATLKGIRELGVTIAIDDFGTGFSSLSYLSKLPVDTLKIDRSFIVEMTLAKQGIALVSTIINLAHSLELKVVAEGVETEAQSRHLRRLKCDESQGTLFCEPVPSDIFEARFLGPPLFAKREVAAI
jgi:diguanylate cyclase (GGDEF)-like protein/PAS domain S-box-containing protein